ncbi:MAG TPA: hypothetical protein VLX61_15620 [Anaerolineales bacterium]|nr:hypothetical protein [Anaerolineales bacterium]
MNSRTAFRITVFLASIAIVMACSFSAPGAAPSESDVATVVASTLQAHVAATNFNNVTYGNVSLSIPEGLATNALTGTVPALTDSQQWSPWAVAPEHIEILLDNYSQLSFYQHPQILIYPAQDFSSMSDQVKENIRRLQGIANRSIPLAAENMPGIPFFNAGQAIAAQMQTISFKDGVGVRLVTQYANGIAPINNSALFYHFQGLTGDGKYYIIATLPTSADFLPADETKYTIDSPGILDFPGYYKSNPTGDDFKAYFQAVADKLNATSPANFKPSLPTLDALIQSISVNP